ncbi:hypothetical protein A2368_01415 [Candidatus Collierbacteria bacterium RIFOXYB1_FULL_49_13]|uniref:Uncharacterized protein n=1 Tax=Candidatus Collierbacteria bacterium RIFOXYB1_FULL_49_13 TaxID=1817728 RepID=A0A1F5FG75_9BACT|nr:MAG: hypothetical protein A2368_01415 [Candidatus Collierbacteria bacterium RIFOXYB1_FULL_49_13]
MAEVAFASERDIEMGRNAGVAELPTNREIGDPAVELAREKMISRLRQEGRVEIIDGAVVFEDEQSIRDFMKERPKDFLKQVAGPLLAGDREDRSVMGVMMELWDGVQVNTEERLVRGEAPLYMFYIAPDDIYDTEAVFAAAQKAFIGGWEMGRTVMNKAEASYPTVSGGRVPLVETALMAGIYGFGEGERGQDGELWVRNFKDDGRYVQVTGEWVTNHVLKTFGSWTFDNGFTAVDEGLPELWGRGLLVPNDFRRREGIWTVVQYKGMVGLVDDEGVMRRYNLGTENAGKYAERVGNNQYVIYRYVQGEIVPESRVDITGISRERMVYRGGTVDVREVIRPEPLEDAREIQSYAELIRFKNVLRKAGRNDMDRLNTRQQFLLMNLWREYGGSEVNPGVVCEVLKSFDLVNAWLAEWEQQAGRGKLGDIRRIFLTRVGQAFRAHMQDIAARVFAGEDQATDELVIGNEMLEVLNDCIRGEGGWRMRQDNEHPKLQIGGREGTTRLVEDVTVIFENNAYPGREMSMVIRPKEGEFRGTQREACLRINYKEGRQQIMGLRIDLSFGKVSLDFDAVKHLGAQYHKDTQFEEALNSPKVFEQMGHFFAQMLGVENLEKASGGKKVAWKRA